MVKTENYGIPEIIAENFRAQGIEQIDTEMPLIFRDDEFLYRITDDEIQVSTRKNFDRWANSVEFSLHYQQGINLDIGRLLFVVRSVNNEKKLSSSHDGDCETIDLSSYL